MAQLRLRITQAAEKRVRGGHPWVFGDSVREQSRDGKSGEFAVVYDRKDRFLAIGLFDPQSPIRVRILHQGKPVQINAEWWVAQLERAVERRSAFFDSQTNGYRLIHGENDGWPGLTLDRYDQTFVLKIYTGAWLPMLNEIARMVRNELRPERLVLRLSRNIRPDASDRAGSRLPIKDGEILFGEPVVQPVVFMESGLRFEADVVRGQKTGFFLDQRENRRRVERLAQGRRMLNAFSFSGGFSLYAARGGADAVTDLDISSHALESARRNFALNSSDSKVTRARHETVQADAFDWLSASHDRRYDLIVLDPPSFAKRETERAAAIGAYQRLAALGIERLANAGILAACSCSAHVAADEFFGAVRAAAKNSGRKFEELETTGHPPDHPATFDEAHYLKAIYLRFTSDSARERPRSKSPTESA